MTNHETQLETLAREAAVAYAESQSVGEFLRYSDEGEGITTFYFASKLKGYHGWEWCVALVQLPGEAATISEIVLLPSEKSLLAPAWVPWSERLAEWKALQADQEALAAAEAEAEAGEQEETEVDETKWTDAGEAFEQDEVEHDLAHEEQHVIEELGGLSLEDDSASSDLEESENSESNAEDAGVKPPRFSLRNRRWGKKKKK